MHFIHNISQGKASDHKFVKYMHVKSCHNANIPQPSSSYYYYCIMLGTNKVVVVVHIYW